MKKALPVLFASLLLSEEGLSQNIGINATGGLPEIVKNFLAKQEPDHTGESDLSRSSPFVFEHPEPHYLPLQRYDLLNEQDGYGEPFWTASNSLFYILQVT